MGVDAVEEYGNGRSPSGMTTREAKTSAKSKNAGGLFAALFTVRLGTATVGMTTLLLFGRAMRRATSAEKRRFLAQLRDLLVGGDGGGGGGCELCDAFDHVAYGAEGAERFVGDLDVEGLFDLEGDVDLVEGVDVELVEGAGQGDGVRRDALRFGDDVDAACGDVVHGDSASSDLPNLQGCECRCKGYGGHPACNFSLSAGVIRLQAVRQYAKRAVPMTDVDLEEMFEEDGVALKGAEGEGAEAREAVDQEQAAGHEAGRDAGCVRWACW